MKLATLYANFVACDFDLEAAIESPKRLVETWEDAVRWAESEMAEGRGEKLEWKRYEHTERTVSWECECNEHGAPEEWILTVQEI